MAGQWAGNYDARISVYIVLSMIPAGIAGFTLRDTIEGAFQQPGSGQRHAPGYRRSFVPE